MFRRLKAPLAALVLATFATMACTSSSMAADRQTSSVHHPAWAARANIYEVNIRQFTPEGTFAAFERHLPRLKRMGVDILWIMPINPISELKRKGSLGSYYAVRDYHAVNPAYGDLDDFRHLVRAAHALHMKVILDWVANHTGWDNVWISAHPDWFKRSPRGELEGFHYVDPSDHHTEVWEDVVGLDYSRQAVRDGMIEAMSYWLKETDIDGFRCDVAWTLPVDFWDDARARLERIKPVFMLAEADTPEMQLHAFDMTYDWGLYHRLADIAHGKADARKLTEYYTRPPRTYPLGAYRMTFTSDHDENSWAGSDQELYGEGFEAFAVLAATLPGMPLIYSGQEAGNTHRLAFFEKDAIDWKRYGRTEFYAGLLKLKHDHPALANGADGGDLQLLETSDDHVFAFRRVKGRDRVTVVANLSATPRTIKIPGAGSISLAPWAYRIGR